jgi:hypothetical protein
MAYKRGDTAFMELIPNLSNSFNNLNSTHYPYQQLHSNLSPSQHIHSETFNSQHEQRYESNPCRQQPGWRDVQRCEWQHGRN